MAEWWNTSFYFRRGIAISPDPLRPVKAGYPVYVNIDHAVYLAANKLRAEFDDIAIVYQPPEEALATPITYVVPHKLIYDPDVRMLSVVFNAEDDITELNTDYYIYFNNPVLTNLPDTDPF